MEKNKKENFADCDFAINCVVDNGVYVGYVVNHEGVICQADSEEEMKEKLHKMLKGWLKMWTENVEKEDCKIKVRMVEADEFLNRK